MMLFFYYDVNTGHQHVGLLKSYLDWVRVMNNLPLILRLKILFYTESTGFTRWPFPLPQPGKWYTVLPILNLPTDRQAKIFKIKVVKVVSTNLSSSCSNVSPLDDILFFHPAIPQCKGSLIHHKHNSEEHLLTKVH